MNRMTPSQFEALRAKTSREFKGIVKMPHASKISVITDHSNTPWKPRHKYNATRTESDGISFGSKAEAAYYGHLKTEQASGRLIFFLRQTAIHLPGSRYVLDFLEFWANGDITWTDVKGFETASFKIKRRAVEAIYPFKIRTVKMLKSGPRYDEDK